MQQLAELLQTPKSAEFNTLTCLRWFHSQQDARYGLLFKIPDTIGEKQISLHSSIRTTRTLAPTLEQRFGIASTIGKSLLKWHQVGWVHQGISSRNIVFFSTKLSKISIAYDYSIPYLCGFEYARQRSAHSTGRVVEDFEHNVYRHPHRQGIGAKYHNKKHDLYAYGVLLLEIGMWELVGRLFNPEEKKTVSPREMREKLIKFARNY